MNKPIYTQIRTDSLAFSKDILGKWYCVTFVYDDKRRYARYMSPTGWKKTCHYFANKREAQLEFGKYGWDSLPLTQQEIQDQITIEQDCWDAFDYDRVDYLD